MRTQILSIMFLSGIVLTACRPDPHKDDTLSLEVDRSVIEQIGNTRELPLRFKTNSNVDGKVVFDAEEFQISFRGAEINSEQFLKNLSANGESLHILPKKLGTSQVVLNFANSSSKTSDTIRFTCVAETLDKDKYVLLNISEGHFYIGKKTFFYIDVFYNGRSVNQTKEFNVKARVIKGRGEIASGMDIMYSDSLAQYKNPITTVKPKSISFGYNYEGYALGENTLEFTLTDLETKKDYVSILTIDVEPTPMRLTSMNANEPYIFGNEENKIGVAEVWNYTSFNLYFHTVSANYTTYSVSLECESDKVGLATGKVGIGQPTIYPNGSWIPFFLNSNEYFKDGTQKAKVEISFTSIVNYLPPTEGTLVIKDNKWGTKLRIPMIFQGMQPEKPVLTINQNLFYNLQEPVYENGSNQNSPILYATTLQMEQNGSDGEPFKFVLEQTKGQGSGKWYMLATANNQIYLAEELITGREYYTQDSWGRPTYVNLAYRPTGVKGGTDHSNPNDVGHNEFLVTVTGVQGLQCSETMKFFVYNKPLTVTTTIPTITTVPNEADIKLSLSKPYSYTGKFKVEYQVLNTAIGRGTFDKPSGTMVNFDNSYSIETNFKFKATVPGVTEVKFTITDEFGRSQYTITTFSTSPIILNLPYNNYSGKYDFSLSSSAFTFDIDYPNVAGNYVMNIIDVSNPANLLYNGSNKNIALSLDGVALDDYYGVDLVDGRHSIKSELLNLNGQKTGIVKLRIYHPLTNTSSEFLINYK